MDDQLFQPNPNQETQFSQSQSMTKHFNPKFVIAFIFVLTLGGAAYGGFWWWANRSADTSDWQTYRNEEYGFELRYPNNFYLNNTKADSTDIYSADGLVFSVSFANEEENAASIERIKNRGLKEYGLISGRQVFYFCVFDNCLFSESSLIILDYPAEGSVLFIQHNSTSVAEQILSTFKFIDSEVCLQVITRARNLQTGEVGDFPTSCDVPEGWEMVK